MERISPNGKSCIECNSELVGKQRKFCCKACCTAYHNRTRILEPNVDYNCVICGKRVKKYIAPGHIGTMYKLLYCSRTCKGVGQRGESHHAWNGGVEISSNGYVFVYMPDHPSATKGKVREHRLVMEQHIGRHLRPEEVVHHKNGDTADNRIENLELFANNGEHKKAHEEESPRERDRLGRFKPIATEPKDI